MNGLKLVYKTVSKAQAEDYLLELEQKWGRIIPIFSIYRAYP